MSAFHTVRSSWNRQIFSLKSDTCFSQCHFCLSDTRLTRIQIHSQIQLNVSIKKADLLMQKGFFVNVGERGLFFPSEDREGINIKTLHMCHHTVLLISGELYFNIQVLQTHCTKPAAEHGFGTQC